MDCKKIFERLVDETSDYIRKNDLKSMVLGISGGIDSTVVAVICHHVAERTGCRFIGRSLVIKNKADEFNTARRVGMAFCDDFKEVSLANQYEAVLNGIMSSEHMDPDGGMGRQTPIANGNIQARLRMIYLYNLAGINKGIVMDTDNLTEHNLGFFTIHGDHGDFNPIGSLWKSEVYELATYLYDMYDIKIRRYGGYSAMAASGEMSHDGLCMAALKESIHLTPTDGLGITNSDLEQIGADSYFDVDDILKTYVREGAVTDELCGKYGEEVVNKVIQRHLASSFKRRKLPVVVGLSKEFKAPEADVQFLRKRVKA